MRLISRSILREIWPPFLLGFAAYTFILLVRTIFLLAEFFVRRSASFPEVLRLVALSVPWIVVLTLPMALLLGVLIGVGRLTSDNELLALRSCGVGPGPIYRPAVAAAGVLSLAVFGVYNFVLPRANEELARSMARAAAGSVVNVVAPRSFREPRPGVMLFFDRVAADNRSLEGVFLKLGDEDSLTERIVVARKGALTLEENRLWLDLTSSTVHELDPAEPSRYRTTWNQTQRILFAGDIWRDPKTRVSQDTALRAQSLGELFQTARQARDPEHRRLAWVEIHKKFSIPFACLAFALVGIPLAETTRRGGRGSSFALSLLILVVYYVLLSSGETWAGDGTIPPAVAMWAPNVLILFVALAVVRRSGRRRSPVRAAPGPVTSPAAPPPSERRAWLDGFLRFPATLDRYVLVRFFSVLLLVLCSVLVLAVIVDYAERVDEIAQNHPPGTVVVAYYRNFLVSIAFQMAPFAVLIATLVALGILSRNNEDTAFKANGVSLYRLGAPILIVTFVASLLSFAAGEYVLPSVREREARYRNTIYGRPADYGLRTVAERNWYYSRDGKIWHREASVPERGMLVSPSVFEFNSLFDLTRRTTAREAVWHGAGWTFRQGWTRTFRAPAESSYHPFLEARVPGDPPGSFLQPRRPADEMRFRELQRHARRLKRTGYPTSGLETALQRKLAEPLLLPLMALLGLSFAFRLGRRGTLAGIGAGLAFGMALLVTAGFFGKLGDVGALPPLLAAWSPNVLFGTAAAYFLLRLET